MSKKRSEQLAAFGGPQTRRSPMPPRSAFGLEELQAVQEVFKLCQKSRIDFGYQGEFEKRYTEAFAKYMGLEGYADAVCTGTAALFVALASLQLPPGSEVLVSPICDPGTVNAIILNQLVPVLMDSIPRSYNVGPEQFSDKITTKTKAVVIVHAAGQAAPIDRICQVARSRSIRVVEDCSQAHGAALNRRKVGTFGDVAAFSTMYRKAHATGGCGGVVFTRDEELYRLVRAYADRGKPFYEQQFDEKNPDQFLFPALNLNLDELSCAIGLKTLGKLDAVIERRLNFVAGLTEAVSESLRVCSVYPFASGDSPFFIPIFVEEPAIRCSKLEFAEAVRREGIDLNPHYRYVVGEWSYAKRYLAGGCATPNAMLCRNSSFNLLFNEHYTSLEIVDIVAALQKVENYFRR